MSHLSHLDLIVLFFFLGLFAGFCKVSLRLPESISQFLSTYLLLTIGFKGGLVLAQSNDLPSIIPLLLIGISTCFLIPLFVFRLGRATFGLENAAALAASYGSVSAVTFIVAGSFLESKNISSSGFMVAVMALMEIPAIAVALYLYKKARQVDEVGGESLFQLALGHKSIFLLIGGFLLGAIMDVKNQVAMKPFFVDVFKGLLAFYLLDLGATASSEIKTVWTQRGRALIFACVVPLSFGLLTLLSCWALNLSEGNSILLAALVGSASYIAAPAAIRISIPEASSALYVSLPLALTFPFNVLLGIPIYLKLAEILWV